MKLLEERIMQEGQVRPGNVLKVDCFLNHQLDVDLLDKVGEEFYRIFKDDGINKILTIEASGIAIACMTARHFNVPVVFAKKAKSDNIEGGLYQSDIFSYTYKKKVTLLVSKEWLCADDKVLIVDDFMANGEAMRGLCDIVSTAGATLVGIGCAVEKGTSALPSLKGQTKANCGLMITFPSVSANPISISSFMIRKSPSST